MKHPSDSPASGSQIRDQNSLTEVLFRFEAAWQAGLPPNIDDYWPVTPVGAVAPSADKENVDSRIKLLTELVLIDLEHRISSGELARVEEYLDRFPELKANAAATMEIIAGEFASRISEHPSVDDYSGRFPSFRKELSVRLNPSELRKRLRMNCPNCRSPIVLIVNEGDSEAECSVCRSSFELDTRIEVSWSPKKLPKLGKFQLLQVVGRGAFGSVYRARDTELDRIVAAKVPRSGQFSSQEDEDRFIREARSVAQLNHPGIVPVYEVGRNENLPYIIAEFVEGVPLSELLRSRRLRFEESVDIIASVAEALQHAHGRGVIHRDLKPANIMLEQMGGVEGDVSLGGSPSDSMRSQTIRTCGRARLMDFGLARRDNGEITVTMEGQLLGTPAYMSPEQARGAVRETDVRSDVYSLGVMLYEMLTGELPFRGSSRMVLQQVIHDDPTSPRKFVSHLPSDLETICLKCMEKDRAKRYQSASDLNAELCRFLNGQPILARPISSVDRTWRWCNRNPVIAILALALTFSMAAGLIGVISQWQRAERNAKNAFAETVRANAAAKLAGEAAEREKLAADSERAERVKAEQANVMAAQSAAEATLQAESAQQVTDFLVGIFQGADRLGVRGYRFGPPPDQTEEPTARELLDRGLLMIETELKDKPAIRASIQRTLAETYVSLGSIETGEQLASSVIETLETLHGDVPHEDTANALAVMAMIRYIQGNYEAAVPVFRRCLQMFDTMYGDADPRGAREKLFFAFVVLESNITGAEIDEAEKLIDQVVAIREAEDDPPPQELAHAYIGQAIIHRVRGRNLKALTTLARASDVLKNDPAGRSYVGTALKAVEATVNWQAGRPEIAAKQSKQVIAQAKAMLGKYHPVATQLQIDLSLRMFLFGKADEAELIMREGVAACRVAYGRQPRTARALFRLGTALMKWRDDSAEEAEELLREAVDIYVEILGKENVRTRRAINEHNRALKALATADAAS